MLMESATVFYNQWSFLTPLKTTMLVIGIVVLLAGVWIVSVMPGPSPTGPSDELDEGGLELFEEAIVEDETGYDWENGRPGPSKPSKLDALKHMLLEEAPRGFRIGLAASSPGSTLVFPKVC